jgi:hypothetical protein
MRTKFGGLNTLSGSLALPEDDSPSLLNVDFDISGSVKKRKGTLSIFKDSATLNPVFADKFVTQLGHEFIVSKYDLNLRVLDLEDGAATVVWSKANVFRDVSLSPFNIPLDNNVTLLLCEKHAPIQVTFQELRQVVTAAGTSIALNVGTEWVNTYVDTVVFVNGSKVTAFKAYSGGVLTLSSLTLAVGDVVYVCTFSWQWWAESLIWYGDSFYQRVSRFGASDEDKHVQIPNSIVTDEIENSVNFGVFAYRSDTYGETFVLKSDNQPQISLDYSFSDGSSYTPSPKSFTNPSKFYVTFGDITNVNERTFTDRDITGNQIKILKHKLKSFDIISLRNTEGDVPVGTVDGTFYYVKYITDDIIELYTDAALTTIVTLGARNSKSFTDVAVDYGSNFIAITAHGFSSGQPVRVTSTGTPPIPTSENSTYYAKSLTANAVELYFDLNLRKKVLFVNRVELFFNSTNVSGDTLLIAQHNLFDSDPVRFRTANGTLPGTINSTNVFYVRVLTAGAVKIYTDAALTTLVPNYTGLTGDVFMYLDGGTHQLIAEGLTTTVERVAYDAVSFVRLRQLRFNKDTGVLNSNLNVFVGEQLATRNTTLAASGTSPSYYTHTSESLTPYTLTALKQKFVSFTAETPIGVPKDTFITLVNTETKWCGSAAVNTKYAFNNGSYVPAYGFGDYADYDAGVFPTFGALYQSRLCLGGIGALVIVSGVYDKLVKDQPYRYFQITDDLSNPTLDPFSIRVPFPQSDTVRALRQWQQYLFVFTRSSTFKTTLDSNNLFSANVPNLTLTANVGCVGRSSVDVTENTLYFVSDGGVYDMGVVLQNEYRASEISVPLRNIFQEFTDNAVLKYDSFNNKVYVYDSGRLFIFFTDARVWSEYRSVLPWDITAFVVWSDSMLMCCKNLCDFQIIKTEFEKYIDFAKEFTSGEVYVQPCSASIPSYTGVSVYDVPIVMTPMTTEQDIHVLQNGTRIEFGTDWIKLPDNRIQVINPVAGTLRFFYRLVDTFNGAVLFKDNEAFPMNGATLGLVSASNICTRAPYNGDTGGGGANDNTNPDIGLPDIYLPRDAESLASDVRAFLSFTVTYTNATVFSRAYSDTPGYAAFVSSGVSSAVEEVTFTDSITTISMISGVSDNTLPSGSFKVDGSIIDTGITDNATTVFITVELWSKTPSIPLSRLSLFFGANLNGAYANTADPTQGQILVGGNPADRSTTGTLQPNGLYRATAAVGAQFSLGVGNSQYHISSLWLPKRVPIAPDIEYLGGVLVP